MLLPRCQLWLGSDFSWLSWEGIQISNKVNLTSPGRIGTLELRNRMFQTAMGSNQAEPDGNCSDRTVAFYEARARGGAALVNIGAIGVAYPHGLVMRNQVGISEDRFIPGLRRIAKAVQAHGAKIAAQLQHGGAGSTGDMIAGQPLWVPSHPKAGSNVLPGLLFDDEIEQSPFGLITRPPSYHVMDKADIQLVVSQFTEAARRAVEAGFDGIEIHAAHGFLIRSFLSPATNTRTDEYGGSVENRARFLIEIIGAIREKIGRDFPLWCKFNVIEFNIENGFTVEDACKVAQLAERAGSDAITCSSYSGASRGKGLVSGSAPMNPANYVAYAAKVREAVNIPVIAAGRLELDVANDLLGEGKVDFIGMGRKLLADPELPRKVLEERTENIRPCIYCFLCLSELALDQPVRCAANGFTGRESQIHIPEASLPRHVVVVGGGPGGMEVARLLDRMGHRITLLEASEQLGGTARIAAIAYEPNGRLVDWLKRQVENSSIEVYLNNRATLETIMALEPHAVIVATGAIRPRPEIPGATAAHVFDGNDLRRLLTGASDDADGSAKLSFTTRALMGAGRKLGLTSSPDMIRRASQLWMPLGKRIVIIGGDLVGLELAEFLVHRGRAVTVIDDTAKFGLGLPPLRRGALLDELEASGVTLLPDVRNITIEEKHVYCTDAQGSANTVASDNVILAKGASEDLSLATRLREAGIQTHTVGDCKGVGYIAQAMRDAADVACSMR